MKKLFLLSVFCLIWAGHVSAVTVSDVCGMFKGNLNIGGDNYPNKEIYLLSGTESDKVTFVLPQFTYGSALLGDIVLVNIPMDNSGHLTLNNATLYLPAIQERATIDIIPSLSDGGETITSALTSSAASVLLQITVASLPEPMLVYFYGTRQSGNYSIVNGGFDGSWTNNEINGWHSFKSATGSYNSFVSGNTQQFFQANGHTGKGACITSNMLVGVKANGNMTNGQMNAGSMTATDGTNNYNFSDPSNTGYNTPFVGNPDSMTFWVKYVPADRNANNSVNVARMHTAITTNARYQDPEDGGNYSNVRIAEATSNYKATSSLGWQQITVPFVYNGASKDKAAYIMVTFTTNQTPGGGSTYSSGGLFNKKYYYDSCYIDDVALIYDTRLASLSFNSRSLTLNSAMNVEESYCDSCYALQASAQGIGALTFTGYDATSRKAVVYVAGNDYAANSNSMRMYTIQMSEPTPTGVQDAVMNPTSVKYLRNGRLYILRNGHTYDVMGRMLQ